MNRYRPNTKQMGTFASVFLLNTMAASLTATGAFEVRTMKGSRAICSNGLRRGLSPFTHEFTTNKTQNHQVTYGDALVFSKLATGRMPTGEVSPQAPVPERCIFLVSPGARSIVLRMPIPKPKPQKTKKPGAHPRPPGAGPGVKQT